MISRVLQLISAMPPHTRYPAINQAVREGEQLDRNRTRARVHSDRGASHYATGCSKEIEKNASQGSTNNKLTSIYKEKLKISKKTSHSN